MKILTTTGLSQLLSLHPNTIRKLAKNGELPYTKVGGQHLFVDEEILELFRHNDSTSVFEE